MTTAHRPQINARRGGGSHVVSFGGYFTGGHKTGSKHGRDMPSHTSLKYRQMGQIPFDDVEALRRQLEEKERQHFDELRKQREKRMGVAAAVEDASGRSVRDSEDSVSVRQTPSQHKAMDTKQDTDAILAAFDDADADDKFEGNGEEHNADDSDEDDDEDDTEALMRELERIRKEREEERLRKEREAAELAEKETTEAILKGNPLLMKGEAAVLGSSGASFGAPPSRRRFGDDTVFSHTHANEPELKKRFINDMIRSDFHRRFLQKFVA